MLQSDLTTALTPTFIALGNFDGVHRGHQQVVQSVYPDRLIAAPSQETSWRSSAKTSGGRDSLEPTLHEPQRSPEIQQTQQPYLTVVTFKPHPQEFFTGQPRSLLTPLGEKVIHLQSLGIEQLVLLPFNRELASLSPEKFVQQILVDQLQAQRISVGFDFRFGYQRAGTAEKLKAIAATYGIQVVIVSPQICEGERISSSAIRQALQEGNLQQANRLLGRSYSLIGQVIRGQQLGQQIGFPTANLQLPAEKYLPCQGVYCVRIKSTILEHPQIGVMNLGCRPTVDGTQQTIEVHLLNWSGNLYKQTLTVHLDQFLRPEQRFASLEALQAQIQADCAAACAYYQSAVK